jgi:hypothetical protein
MNMKYQQEEMRRISHDEEDYTIHKKHTTKHGMYSRN